MPDTSTQSETSYFRSLYSEEVRKLSELQPARVLRLIAWQWVLIAAAVAVPVAVVRAMTGETDLLAAISRLSFAGLCVVLAVHAVAMVVIAGRQHALPVIMHDAVHYRLFHNRRLAEIVSNWFCAFPVGMVTSLYRRSHLAHHFFTNKPADPDWAILVKDEDFAFPKARGAFYKLLLKDLAGANLGSWWKTIRAWLGYPYLFRRAGGGLLSRSERIQFGIFWLAVLAVVTWLRAWPWFVMLWLLPNYTLTLAFMRVRAIAEHDLHRSETELDRTRHVDGTFIERNTVAPLNINYHIVHHLWPSIPLYNLPKMHAIVMQNARFRARALAWRSYFGKAGGLFSTLLA